MPTSNTLGGPGVAYPPLVQRLVRRSGHLARRGVAVLACLGLAGSGLACSGPAAEPVSPPLADPCVALRAEIDAIRARHACSADSDCELARGILPAGVTPSSGPPRYGLEGLQGPLEGVPCGTAIHREDHAALEEALSRFATHGCGPVSETGSTACMTTSHGAHATCRVSACTLAM